MDKPTATRITLTDDASLGRLQVDLEAFFEFSFWLAEELEDLVAIHGQRSSANSPRRTAS